MKHLLPLIVVLMLMGVGCEHYHESKTVETTVVKEPAPPPPPSPAPVRPPTVDSVILNVQDAPDAGAEAAALNRLQAWMRDHQMMFKVTAADGGGRVVPNPATMSYPVTARVTIFQQQQPIRDFSFTPKDNRNLGILGVQ